MNIFRIDRFDSKVIFHPYRTAMVYDRFFTLNRSSDEGREFENHLAEAAGVTPDNHTAYTIQLSRYDSDRPVPEIMSCAATIKSASEPDSRSVAGK